MKHRQIKFRMWSKEAKKYYYDSSIVYDCLKFSQMENTCLSYEDLIWQQFTGLYDKNKKPIYEGDRVKFGYTENRIFFGEVVYFEDRATFGVKSQYAGEDFDDLVDYMQFFEVVGNIFESPCNPDHNGECLVCDELLDGCPFNVDNSSKIE